MRAFKKISAKEIKDNPFCLIGDDWGLVTAEKNGSVNMMTVSWGGVGVMWNKPVAFTFIRPQRYTFGFLESGSGFTISFFDEAHRKALSFCGSKSGRDHDKVKETGLTTVFTDDGLPYFAEARLTRQMSRDEALALLQSAASADAASQETIDSAMNAIAAMATCSMKEAQIENLLIAKDFADCVVYIGNDSVTVAVPAPSEGLSEEAVARITDIICSETEYAAAQLNIIEVRA